MDNSKIISQAIIKRLPRYYRFLGELMEDGIEHISSSDLSKIMGVTASQIRQDLNNFGGFGQQGYGYNVRNLREEIGHILGIDENHNVVIVGAGNFGSALAGFDAFRNYGFQIIALFDTDPAKIGTLIHGIPVYDISELKGFIGANNVEIVALTIPKSAAKQVAVILSETDIKGIWNFAHTELKVPDHIYVQSVHLSESLMRLCFNMNNQDRIIKD